jgi:flagellin-like protein
MGDRAQSSIGTLIIFIATMLIALGVSLTMTGVVNEYVQDAENNDAAIDSANTRISLVSDTEFIYDGGASVVTIHVKNEGSINLGEGEATIYLEGEPVEYTVSSATGDTDGVWERGELLTFSFSRDLDEGTYTLEIRINSISETVEIPVTNT